MASIVDVFADDGATQDRLYVLKCNLKSGERSDWFLPRFNHIVSQTCGAFLVERQRFPKWYDELGELLANNSVESMLPGSYIDSFGDAWVQTHRWKWREGETAA